MACFSDYTEHLEREGDVEGKGRGGQDKTSSKLEMIFEIICFTGLEDEV